MSQHRGEAVSAVRKVPSHPLLTVWGTDVYRPSSLRRLHHGAAAPAQQSAHSRLDDPAPTAATAVDTICSGAGHYVCWQQRAACWCFLVNMSARTVGLARPAALVGHIRTCRSRLFDQRSSGKHILQETVNLTEDGPTSVIGPLDDLNAALQGRRRRPAAGVPAGSS